MSSNIIEEILNINRPKFINISGSYVLYKILSNNNKNINWNPSDIDIFISINDKYFNYYECLDYLSKLVIHIKKKYNSDTILNTLRDMIFYIGNKITLAFNAEILNAHNINYRYIVDTPVRNMYLVVSDRDLIDVYKIKCSDTINIDFILIKCNIEQYIHNNFDMSVVRNYINYKNKIVQFNNIADIVNGISEYSTKKFIEHCNSINNPSIYTFITRIQKYINRGFKIYLKNSNFAKCTCIELNCNCLTTILLDTHFINAFNEGHIYYFNYINDYINTYEDLDKINTKHYINKSMTNRELIYKNEYSGQLLRNAYIYHAGRQKKNGLISNIVFNKYVLLKDLNINYISHPNNILRIFNNLLE